jgi:hypothetical protein
VSRRPGRIAFVVLGALLQLAIWLVVRPDLAGPQWSAAGTGTWLGIEIGVAALLGVMAPGRRELVAAVLTGWGVQALHFAFLGAHYDDTLWGIGLFGQALLAAVAVGVAVMADRLTSRG